ncbi:MAG: heme exporter protein CcmB [Saprospiraceae bacterium]|nr:heme exporter protein CcmB [Saprospiraceae bacterium]
MDVQKIRHILIKDWKIEFRQSFTFYSVLLFAVTVVFFIYKSFNNINAREWSVLFWIIMLFSGLNAAMKTFLQEKKDTWHYYYTLFDPIDLLAAKLIYNTIFLLLLSFLVIGFMSWFMFFPIHDLRLFSFSLMLGIIGISTVFTFVSVLISAEGANTTLMSILSIPLLLPIMLLVLKSTQVSARLLVDTAVYEDITILGGIDMILLGTIFLLFPYLWRA